MSQSSTMNLRMTVYSSLFTALIIIGSYLSFPIPLNPVPVVLQDFFIMLAGLFLGASWGFTSVALFILLGALGLPVFANGKAGLAVLAGPTGGFLFGFLVAVLVIGFISGPKKTSVLRDTLALIAGNIIIYGIGVCGLKLAVKTTWINAIALGVLPFMIGAVIKLIAAVALARILRPIIHPSAQSSFSNQLQSSGDIPVENQ
jgi:biotin transport system substrate-specific component